MPRLSWNLVLPVAAALALALTWGREPSNAVLAFVAVLLVGAVLAAVHHAEVVAHRFGEPFGSLVLAVAVTIIEVGLIVMLMVSTEKDTSTLARDTVFAALMITVNGIVGISLLVGALKHHLAVFNPEGTGAALATVITLAVVCLVLPTVTTSEPGPEFTPGQLAFAAVASLALYAMFVVTQTIRHRDFFLPVRAAQHVPVVRTDAGDERTRSAAARAGTERRLDHQPVDLDEDGHADPPTGRATVTSAALLVVSLVAVVGLAKICSPAIESAVAAVGFPATVVGVVIALLVLAPETIAAVRAAARDRVQVSLNLALGSAMASIGLTIPALAIASIWLEGPLVLGLSTLQIVLLLVTVAVAILTVVPGRAKPLQGGVHLVLLAAFLFLTVSP
ncbi:MAG: Calcium/proton antiporter [uncultured Nocardioides sp.]|uniref:Calcium/proton antiporter n=1 Tax=uncultured Nocardioides sp. TaxID=198441 RepID=A0A6J4NK44_9ACTN|nr:MAG: Calcium/proton antiporter [uncultured Nocardioides sp.]